MRWYSCYSTLQTSTYYLKEQADLFFLPKECWYYQEILAQTRSVNLTHFIDGDEWICGFSEGHLPRTMQRRSLQIWRNKNRYDKDAFSIIVEYIKAWELVFCYENWKRKIVSSSVKIPRINHQGDLDALKVSRITLHKSSFEKQKTIRGFRFYGYTN